MSLVTISRRPLWVRACLYAKRKILSALQQGYLYLFALPLLRRNRVINPPYSVSRGYGSILVESEVTFLKLAVSKKSTVGVEYEHYVKLLDLHPTLASLLPRYSFRNTWPVSVLSCEKLFKVSPDEALPLAIDAHKRFKETVCGNHRLALSQCPEIAAGLKCIEKKFDRDTANFLQSLTVDYLTHGNYLVGLTHGDFHSRNIMRDREGTYRLIDLDCIRFHGVVAFDPLYFSLEQEWSKTGRLWTETIAQCFATSGENVREMMSAFGAAWSDGLGVAFFLDRLGQDSLNYDLQYTREHLTPVINAVKQATRAA